MFIVKEFMMKRLKPLSAKVPFLFATFLFISSVTYSQTLPTAKSIAAEMGFAWNIGNSLEVPKDPLAWGNPLPTQQLIDSVKAAGFKTIRIPCAWNSHADTTTYVINTSWLSQVKTIVDYCIKDSLFVILNSHWDGGWLEESITVAKKTEVNRRQGAYWRQIAITFRNYDRHLLFASANEPAVQDAYGTAFGEDRMAVLNSYHQAFIDSVRATGGNNASRTLIIQGPRADIELTNKVMFTLPTDKITDRLMAEVHFYPYQFALMENDETWGKVFYYWGKNNHSSTDTDRNPTWGEEIFVDSVFNLMKEQFVNKNIPIVLGEFGAVKRTTLTGDTFKRHILSRRTFYNYVVSSALNKGIIPVAWDAGGKGNLTMTIFDRKTGTVYDLGLLNAIRSGGGLSKLPGDTSLVQTTTGNNAMKVLYSAKDSSWGQVDLGVKKTNMTTYDSILVRTYVNGETNYDSAGTTKSGWVSLSLVTMSKSWTWREASFGTLNMNNWSNYCVPIGADTTDKKELVPADPTKIDFFAIQAYSHGYHGTIYIDWIIFKTKTGLIDTVYSFNSVIPEEGKGNVESVKMIAINAVEADQEWKTATTKFPNSTAVLNIIPKGLNSFHTFTVDNIVTISFTAPISGNATVILKNLLGKTLLSHQFRAYAGINSMGIPFVYHGVMIVQIQMGSKIIIGKVINSK
jgi:aryl-phospho-beta-D-glucosidase BglC (GH1 family)